MPSLTTLAFQADAFQDDAFQTYEELIDVGDGLGRVINVFFKPPVFSAVSAPRSHSFHFVSALNLAYASEKTSAVFSARKRQINVVE